MRKKLVLLAATALVSGLVAVPAMIATPASADVNVTVFIEKDKTITINEFISIDKTITVKVDLVQNLEGLAESDALVNASSNGNNVNLQLGDFSDFSFFDDLDSTRRLALIKDSLGSGGGINEGVIVQLNQDVGDNANQGNVVSAALVDVVSDGNVNNGIEGAVAHSQAEVEQESKNNTTILFAELPEGPVENDSEPFPGAAGGDEPDLGDFHVAAVVKGSINGNDGVVIQANQNAGQNTNQHNVLSAAVGLDALVALADSSLGQESSNNTITDINTFKTSLLDTSMNLNVGIVNLNQSTGHNNNQATVINLAVTSAAAALQPPPAGAF